MALSAEIIRWPNLQLTLWFGEVSCSLRQSSPVKSAMSTNPIWLLRHKWSCTCAIVVMREAASLSAFWTSSDRALRPCTRNSPTTDARLFLTR
jgi:hypothetical protein